MLVSNWPGVPFEYFYKRFHNIEVEISIRPNIGCLLYSFKSNDNSVENFLSPNPRLNINQIGNGSRSAQLGPTNKKLKRYFSAFTR
ncbi:hypothetical protein D3C87_1567870 [compost metagenome]